MKRLSGKSVESKVTDKKLITQTRPTHAEVFDPEVLAQYPVEARTALLELLQSAESKNTKKLPCRPSGITLRFGKALCPARQRICLFISMNTRESRTTTSPRKAKFWISEETKPSKVFRLPRSSSDAVYLGAGTSAPLGIIQIIQMPSGRLCGPSECLVVNPRSKPMPYP